MKDANTIFNVQGQYTALVGLAEFLQEVMADQGEEVDGG